MTDKYEGTSEKPYRMTDKYENTIGRKVRREALLLETPEKMIVVRSPIA